LLLTTFIIKQLKSKKQCAASAVGTKSMTEKTDCNTTRAWSVWLCAVAQAQAVPVRLAGGSTFHHGQREHLFFTASFFFFK
jgi:hypothetical protein